MWCDVSVSGSVESELMWWLELGMMHHLDQTLISRLEKKGQSRKLPKVVKRIKAAININHLKKNDHLGS